MVDERMWGDEDKPEPDQKPGEEQRGKDAPAQVACLSPNPGTYRTVQSHCLPSTTCTASGGQIRQVLDIVV